MQSTRARTLAALWALLIAVLLLVPLPPEQDDYLPVWFGVAMFDGVDKLVHGLLFFVMAYLLAGALDLARYRVAGAFLAATLYGAATEVAQLLFTERSGELADFAADAVGAGLGALVVLGGRRLARGPGTDGESIGEER